MTRIARIAFAFVIVLGGAACGSDSPTNPSGSSTTTGGGTNTQNCFALVGNKGSITATISGLAAFNGTIANGGANLVTGGPVPIFTIGATNIQDGTDVIITGMARLGTSSVGKNVTDPLEFSNMITVLTRSCSAGTGSWFASIAAGSGTITVTSSTTAGISGSFAATLEAGTSSIGTKTISGTFNATY